MLTEVNCVSLPLAASFSFSPDPLLLALPCLLAPNNPPPPGRGTSRPVSICGSRRRHNSLASRHIQSAHSRCSFAIARFLGATVCSLLFASACFWLFPLISARFRPSAAFRSPSRRPIRKAGSEFRFAGFLLPDCFNRHGKGGAEMPSRRLLPAPPVSPLLLACGRNYRLSDTSWGGDGRCHPSHETMRI